MKYYVIYQYYTEPTRIEFCWRVNFREFSSFDKAMEWIEGAKKNSEIRNIIGPLVMSELV